MSDSPPPVSAPIIIFAFTRPDYLRRLCQSLKAQQGVSMPDDRVHLVQDGSRSPRSGIVYGDPALIDASIAAFREVFPKGNVHASAENLGIAMNLHRGEKLAFETLNAEVAYFFEDDLELGPCYVAMLDALRKVFADHPTVGYFAAYGDHHSNSNPEAPQLVPLEHHWGFALTRRCWRAMQPWLTPFHRVYGEVDYMFRPHLRIVELYGAKRVSHMMSSQDVSKTMACADLGFARLNIDVCYARYIGMQGQSFQPKRFSEQGFDKMAYVTTMPERMPKVTAEAVAAFIETKRAAAMAHRRDAFAADLAAMRKRLYHSDLPATREEVEWLWRLLLDRVPPDDAYLTETVGKRTVREIRRGLVYSREGQAKTTPITVAPQVAPQPPVANPALQPNRPAAPAVAEPPRPSPPKLGAPRMPAAERQLFDRVLASGRRRYAEFGAGGSTVMAAQQDFEAMVCVESDAAWAAAVREHPDVAAMVKAGRASVIHADIGPVGDWGAPADQSSGRLWPGYIARMWEEWERRGGFPDLVFVDGRFRVACALSVALLATCRSAAEAPLVMMRDIGPQRPQYARVFNFFRIEETVESLVVLAPVPKPSSGALLAGILSAVADSA